MSYLDPWTNKERLETIRSPLGYLWLLPLVSFLLLSSLFAQEHFSARAVFVGFVLSHVVIMVIVPYGFPKSFVLRKGHVSLSHAVFWSVGWITSVTDLLSGNIVSSNGDHDMTKMSWYIGYVILAGISLYIDVVGSVKIVKWSLSSAKQKPV